MSKNKENVMKPNKEQKGKNAVLIIAVGKHPKMGPGERKYKKGVKKAFNVLKRDDPRKIARKRAERKAKYEARLKRRQAREGGEGVKKPAPKRVENAPPSEPRTGGSVAVRRTPSKKFDSKELPKIVERFSLGDSDNPSELSERNKRDLARVLRINPNQIEVGNPALENSNAFKALENMGRMRFKERDLERDKFTEMMRDGEREEGRLGTGVEAGLDAMANRFPKSGGRSKPEAGGEEEREAKFMQRLRQARSTSDIEDRADKRRRTIDEENEPKTGGLTREPAFNMQPFGHTGASLGGFAGGDTDKPLGFRPPRVPPKLSSPQEEEEEPDLPEYPQFATGAPMDLAFRMLKMSKGNPSMATYEDEGTIHPAAMNYARLVDNPAKYDDRFYGSDTPNEIIDAITAQPTGTEFSDALDKLTPEQKKEMLDRYRRSAKDETSRQMKRIMPLDEGEREDAHEARHVQRMPRPGDE